MRTSPLRAAIGAAAGLVLALAVAVAPASAAPRSDASTTTAASYTCATFNGLTVQQQWVAYNGVAMNAGESITANVSPLSSFTISMTVSSGLGTTFYSAPATSGITFKAATSGTYNLTWSLNSGGTLTGLVWSFTCSSGGSGGTIAPADSDKDGVADTADHCSGTILPDSFSRLAAGSYYANRSGLFVDGTGRSSGITVVDAGGCSGIQIAKKLGLKANTTKAGISLTTLQSWASTH